MQVPTLVSGFAGRVVAEVRAKAKHRMFLVHSRFGLVWAGVDVNNNPDDCKMGSFSPRYLQNNDMECESTR